MKPDDLELDMIECNHLLEKYCKEHGLSYEKLKRLQQTQRYNTLYFSVPVYAAPEKNSKQLNSQNIPILTITKLESSYIIRKTIYTYTYLRV